jgi:two-component system response regulator AtoC
MTIEKILIVDDEALVRNFLSETLKRKGLEVTTAENGMKAVQLLKENTYDLVITDMRMPDLTGIDIIRKVRETSPSTLSIVITAFGTIENAVEAMRLGAFNYLIKPFSPDTIEAVIEKANEHQSLVNENAYLRQNVLGENTSVVAESAAMKKILKEVQQIAKSNANVLIHGESGTGKEVIAHAIYSHSLRDKSPFIKVNCAAIPETLIESEFFGHEKGSFTCALGRRLGRFELANKGTLLLDEITEVPITLQPKLLRAIQEQEFERIGGTKPIKVDVRFISTTNRDIKQAIHDKVLREDLYYRLNVVPIYIPPLRERREDIIPLAENFLKKACQENHTEPKSFTAEARQKLLDYNWPGNVRELSNIIERAVVVEANAEIGPENLFMNLDREEPSPIHHRTGGKTITVPIGVTLQELEKQLIIETLESHNMNRTKTAATLGISIRTLRNKLHEYGT